MTVMSEGLSSWLDDLQSGIAQTVVMSDGKGYSFNCDGTAHYLYENDVTRREPNGRFKRVYTGKVQNGHVSYKGNTKEIPCKNSHDRWENARHVRCGIHSAAGEDVRRAGDIEGRIEYLPMQNAEWKDARPTVIH